MHKDQDLDRMRLDIDLSEVSVGRVQPKKKLSEEAIDSLVFSFEKFRRQNKEITLKFSLE